MAHRPAIASQPVSDPQGLEHLLPVYRRSDIVIARGEGVHLFSPDGKRYLDLASGIAVNSLGHCHPHVVAALKKQSELLWHCSNMYRTEGLEHLAERLCEVTFADKVFFCSSGTEAVECGIKMIRKYHHASSRYRIITMQGGFHGRTLACISAGGNAIARDGYAPLLDGFDAVEFNNLKAVEAAISDKTAGILLEPIQGEGGIREATKEFLKGVRALCDKHGLLLFIDEVQCGMGRTGSLFAHERAVMPDIVSTAKGIGNGFPVGCLPLATDKAASRMTPGSHGSTYGANPLAMAVGNAVLDVMLKPGFFQHVAEMGELLKKELQTLTNDFPQLIEEVRGRGLMLGIKTRVPHIKLVEKLRDAGLLTAPAEDNVIRIMPPLVLEKTHIEEALTLMRQVCTEWKA